MRICFNLPHVFGTHSTEVENSYVLRALLDCLVEIDVAFLKTHRNVPQLYRSGVTYGRTHGWEPIPALYRRGVGDCKSLTAALVAQYRVQGIEAIPVFRFISNKKGGNDYHILVQVPGRDGHDKTLFEDPSRKLGMSADLVRKFYDTLPTF
jgi:hypothetical protein